MRQGIICSPEDAAAAGGVLDPYVDQAAAPGRPRWFVMSAAPLEEFGGVVVPHVDITARKQVDLELEPRKG